MSLPLLCVLIHEPQTCHSLQKLLQDHGGGSQFGCPSGDPQADEQNLPLGLSRLLQTPDWLDGDCSISCITQYNYTFWMGFITGNRGTNSTTCTDT